MTTPCVSQDPLLQQFRPVLWRLYGGRMRCFFLEAPREIRNIIYSYTHARQAWPVIEQSTYVINGRIDHDLARLPKLGNNSDIPIIPHPRVCFWNLAQVNRQIKDELEDFCSRPQGEDKPSSMYRLRASIWKANGGALQWIELPTFLRNSTINNLEIEVQYLVAGFSRHDERPPEVRYSLEPVFLALYGLFKFGYKLRFPQFHSNYTMRAHPSLQGLKIKRLVVRFPDLTYLPNLNVTNRVSEYLEDDEAAPGGGYFPCEQFTDLITKFEPWGFLAKCIEVVEVRCGEFRAEVPIKADRNRVNGIPWLEWYRRGSNKPSWEIIVSLFQSSEGRELKGL